MKSVEKFSSLFVAIALIGTLPNYYKDEKVLSILHESTSDRIIREGYKVEEHTVLTDDGYFLTLHRIPGAVGAPAVFLQHGLLSNSFDWVVTGKKNGLAFILVDLGYDVWMGNSRGNTYSRSHKIYSPSEPYFWNFSWHEMGVYDLPAAITYVTNLKNDSLIYVGHSMGTTIFYVMAIERPDVADNVKAMFSLAPVAFMQHWQSPVRYLSPFANQIETLTTFFGIFELLPQSDFSKFLQKYGCETLWFTGNICMQFAFAIAGHDSFQFNHTLSPVILSHTPAGTSMKSFIHYLQVGNTGRFQYYDYGSKRNLKMYNNSEPPEYDVSKIQVPIGIFWSDSDYFSNPRDVQRFYNLIPKKIVNYKVPYPTFSHIDHMWGIDAPKLVYSKLLSEMENYR